MKAMIHLLALSIVCVSGTPLFAAAPKKNGAKKESSTSGYTTPIVGMDALQEKIDQGPVVLKFTADWCSSCTKMQPAFESAAKNHSDITFVTVDVDEPENKAIDNSYDHKSYPTTIFFKDGKKVGMMQGGLSEDLLEAKIKEFLGSASTTKEVKKEVKDDKKKSAPKKETNTSTVKEIVGKTEYQETIKNNSCVALKCGTERCGHCKKMAPEFKKAAKTQEGVALFVEVDADKEGNKKLVDELDVEGFPTTFFFKDGELVATEVGGMTEAELNSKIAAITAPKKETKTAKNTKK